MTATTNPTTELNEAEEIRVRAERLLGDPLVDIKEVATMIRLCPSSIYREMAAGRFPRPKKLSSRKRMWHRSTILEWLASRESAAQ